MLHAHDFLTRTARRGLPRLPDAVPLAASGYVALRRKAAGLTEAALAERMAALYVHVTPPREGVTMAQLRREMLTIVQGVELPGAVARRPATIDALAAVMPFDPAIYWQLARDPADRHPRVCRGCGASMHDHTPPKWATPTSCIRCDVESDAQ